MTKKITNKIFLALILLGLVLSACQPQAEDEPEDIKGHRFAIYLVRDTQISGQGAQRVDIDSLSLVETPLIIIDDIVSYDWDKHEMNLTEEAYLSFVTLFMAGLPSDGVPFVVEAQQQRVYVGAIFSPFSSQSFDGVVVLQPFDPSGQPLNFSLGYPSEDNFTGEDPRNDIRILEAFEAAGILR